MTTVIETAFDSMIADLKEANTVVWVSVAGGTANVMAGITAALLGVTFEEAHITTNKALEEDWYEFLNQEVGVADDEYSEDITTWWERALKLTL